MHLFLNKSINVLEKAQGYINILWTHMEKSEISANWTPNHFVSLIAESESTYIFYLIF
jgi:hypothetical protein